MKFARNDNVALELNDIKRNTWRRHVLGTTTLSSDIGQTLKIDVRTELCISVFGNRRNVRLGDISVEYYMRRYFFENLEVRE